MKDAATSTTQTLPESVTAPIQTSSDQAPLAPLLEQLHSYYAQGCPNALEVREWIDQLLQSQHSFPYKEAELGMLLFYLSRDRGQPIPLHESLLAYRSREIHEQIALLTKDINFENLNGPEKERVLTGQTHYILRALGRLVLTREEKVNRGGLKAIELLLSDPSFRLSQYLTDSHRRHILEVVDVLLTHPTLQNFLECKLTVHESMKRLIQIDLKWPEGEVGSYHGKLDCILALFFDIRQLELPNCFAVNTTNFILKNYLPRVLLRLYATLKLGKLTLNRSSIPLAPLVLERLSGERSLLQGMDVDNARALDSFTSLLKYYGIFSLPSDPTRAEKTSLYTLALACSKGKLSNQEIAELSQHYHAYKRNALITLLIVIAELKNENQNRYAPSGKEIFCERERFLDLLTQALLPEESTEHADLLSEVEKTLTTTLWFESNGEEGLHIQGDGQTILYGPIHRRRSVSNIPPSSLQTFGEALRVGKWLFSTKEGYYRIETFTAFEEYLCAIVDEAAQHHPTSREYAEGLKNTIRQPDFCRKFANFCAAFFQHSGKAISAEQLLASDLLFLPQDGGAITNVFSLYGIEEGKNYRLSHVLGGTSPTLALHSLIQQVPSVSSSLLVTGKKHVFTLTPKEAPQLFSPTLRGATQAAAVTGALVGEAARALGKFESFEAPDHVVEEVRNKLRTLQNIPWEDFPTETPTYRDLKTFVLEYTDPAEGYPLIDEAFSKLTWQSIPLILLLDDLRIPTSRYLEINDHTNGKFATQQPQTVHTLSQIFSQLLKELGIANLSCSQVAKAICKCTHRPTLHYIGDLGWLEEDTERPMHIPLTMRPHFASGHFGFYSPSEGRETLLDPNDYSTLNVYIPITMPSREQRV